MGGEREPQRQAGGEREDQAEAHRLRLCHPRRRGRARVPLVPTLRRPDADPGLLSTEHASPSVGRPHPADRSRGRSCRGSGSTRRLRAQATLGPRTDPHPVTAGRMRRMAANSGQPTGPGRVCQIGGPARPAAAAPTGVRPDRAGGPAQRPRRAVERPLALEHRAPPDDGAQRRRQRGSRRQVGQAGGARPRVGAPGLDPVVGCLHDQVSHRPDGEAGGLAEVQVARGRRCRRPASRRGCGPGTPSGPRSAAGGCGG